MTATPELGSFLAAARSALGRDAVRDQPADCLAYGGDNSKRIVQPAAVLSPRDHDQVLASVRLCREHGLTLTCRGRGTGTAAAAVPAPGGVVLSTERMTDVLELSLADRYVRVQPGIINGELQRALAEHGMRWAPDPTSADYCTIGGNLACNAAGPRAVAYGTPRENTLGLRAVTGAGQTIRTGTLTTKGVVGYDLTRLLIGSEGTLAVITEAVLKLIPVPETVRTLRASYPDAASAAAAVARIMARPTVPSAVEFMDAAALALVADQSPLPPATGAVLLVEVEASAATADTAQAALAQAASEGALAVEAARDVDAAAALWRVRKALSPALRRIAPRKINEDVVVPVSRMPELVDALAAIAREHGIPIVSFGHAGNGNLHVNLLLDPADPAQAAAEGPCLAAVFRKVLDLGGTLSGEHGIGRVKRDFVGLEVASEELALMRRLRAVFDPDGTLNPGSTIPDEREAVGAPTSRP